MMNVSRGTFFTSSRKHSILILAIFFLVTIVLSNMYIDPNLQEEEGVLLSRITELKLKLQHFTDLYQSIDADVHLLSHLLTQPSSNQTTDMLGEMDIEEKIYSPHIHPPSVYNFLPHLKQSPFSLQPAYRYSKGRLDVTTVIGIPTVKREGQSYLIATLNDLFKKMTKEEQNETLIVLFIAEVDESYVQHVADDVKRNFALQLECGLLEIISPHPSYYPDLSKIKSTLGDSETRTRWRSKQNLDYAFLMMYAQRRGLFYVQLEDDIVAKEGFITAMKQVAIETVSKKQKWFLLDFCQLGFIGKMFRSVDLPWLVQFFFMFYSDKPVDWLLDGLIQTKACNLEKDNNDCRAQKNALWLHRKPSLFQHIGTISSLKGKIQKLKDKQFGKIPLYYPHDNLKANVNTSIKAYKTYTLQRAYDGDTFFWGVMPKNGDWISFEFEKPTKITSYKFRTGNVEHPSDKLTDTSISFMVDGNGSNYTINVGHFNESGMAEGKSNLPNEKSKGVLLTIHKESENWLILSEICIEGTSF